MSLQQVRDLTPWRMRIPPHKLFRILTQLHVWVYRAQDNSVLSSIPVNDTVLIGILCYVQVHGRATDVNRNVVCADPSKMLQR